MVAQERKAIRRGITTSKTSGRWSHAQTDIFSPTLLGQIHISVRPHEWMTGCLPCQVPGTHAEGLGHAAEDQEICNGFSAHSHRAGGASAILSKDIRQWASHCSGAAEVPLEPANPTESIGGPLRSADRRTLIVCAVLLERKVVKVMLAYRTWFTLQKSEEKKREGKQQSGS
ncbi:unnamed protein product [Sympodiomycopsis kandeliae]